MKTNSFSLFSNKGQSAVEYILLTGVIVALVAAVFRSPRFKNLFDKDGTFYQAMGKQIGHSYRNALFVRQNPLNYSASPHHPSFYNSSTNESRFFVTEGAYP